jgi:3-oxoacyl-[acyl-carrier protein] reductase
MKEEDQHQPQIAGAASGIGLAIATLFAEEGSSVHLTDIDEFRLDVAVFGLQAKFGKDRIGGIHADVRQMAEGERIVASAVSKFGGVDILVANAVGVLRIDFSELASYQSRFKSGHSFLESH